MPFLGFLKAVLKSSGGFFTIRWYSPSCTSAIPYSNLFIFNFKDAKITIQAAVVFGSDFNRLGRAGIFLQGGPE